MSELVELEIEKLNLKQRELAIKEKELALQDKELEYRLKIAIIEYLASKPFSPYNFTSHPEHKKSYYQVVYEEVTSSHKAE